MFIGIGSIAWLFNISKQQQPPAKPKPTIPKKPVHLTGISRKRTISNEELNAGLTTTDPLSEKPSPELERPARPFPPAHKPLEWGDVTQKPADPTLDYSILLIAKPLPFKFDMAPRDEERACRIRQESTGARIRGGVRVWGGVRCETEVHGAWCLGVCV
jgi:hypothetical protein